MRSISEKHSSAWGLEIWALAVLAFAVATNVPKLSAQEYKHAKTKLVDCDRGQTITRLLGFIDPGDTVIIKGTCNENLLFSSSTGRFNGVTLDGRGAATISGPDSTLNAVELTGVSRFTIRGLTITGGA